MKSPKGFGKNYFTLSAIQAFSVNIKLNAETSNFLHFLSNPFFCETIMQNVEPPTQEPFLELKSDKPCHCNLFFKLKIRLILLLNHFIPRCPYYTTHFAFRRTGVHPPL